MKKISSILYKFLMAFCVLLTLGSLMGLPALNSIISTVLFGGCTFWLYKKIKSISAEIAREEAEKALEREREEAERVAKLAKDEAEKFSSLGMTHGDYPQIYQEDLSVYISIQSNLMNDDDYGRLKIINTVETGNDRGYFQTEVPVCKIHWLNGTQKEKTELMALLLEVERFEAMDEADGIMTFLYPAIHATKSFSGSKILSQIVYFISNKSVEQIQSLQTEAEALIEPIIKVDRAEFTSGILSKRIFNVELKTQYDVAADEVQMSFSILIVEEDTRQKFAVTREKVLGIA